MKRLSMKRFYVKYIYLPLMSLRIGIKLWWFDVKISYNEYQILRLKRKIQVIELRRYR